jgi:hypothetical protein
MAKKAKKADGAVAELPVPAADHKDELAVFRQQDVIVAGLKEKYGGLTISGVGDRVGFAAVRAARILVKNTRIDVEKTRELLKAGVLERGRKIDGEAKRLTALLTPLESYLQDQEDAVVKEKERLKQEAAAALAAKIKKRFDDLLQWGYSGDQLAFVPSMTDEAFESLLAQATVAKAERDRQAAKAKRLQDQRDAEIAEEKKRLTELQRKLEADRESIRAEKAKLDVSEAIAKVPRMSPSQFDREYYSMPRPEPVPVDNVQPPHAVAAAEPPAADQVVHNKQIIISIANSIQQYSEAVPETTPWRAMVLDAIAGAVKKIRDIAAGL